MARYIDAEKLKEVLNRIADDPWNANAPTTWSKAYEYVANELLDEQPTADVVEVVRCKDCKYGVRWDGRLGCEWHGFYETKDDWFCADGERKENESVE